MPVLILHNIRSAQNVGSIFRTADAVGVSKIYLTGYTPAPLDRFGREVGGIAKAALGAERSVSWECAKNPTRLIRRFKKEGVRVIALEQSTQAQDYRRARLAGPTAVILGNELRGVSKALLRECDAVFHIPMRGKKESLNVSVAAGVFLFSLCESQ